MGGDRAGRVLAVALLVLLTLYTLGQNSVVVDGSRVFWLDDDEMISMRYGRNLAEGHGLVWNPGERPGQRVEGYTNFLWTLVMAGVHLLPLGDGWTSVVMVLLNLVLAVFVLVLAERLMRVFVPGPTPLATAGSPRGRAQRQPQSGSRFAGLTQPRAWAVPILWLTLALCMDLVYWSANGFETTLLTVLFLAVVVRFLEEPGRTGPGTWLLLGLLTLVRSDALVVWAAAAVVAVGAAWIGDLVAPDRRSRLARTAVGLATSLTLPAAHFLFRLLYYGSWLPNTYYLKVAGLEIPWSQGLGYVQAFVGTYGAPLAMAAIGVPLSGDRRRWFLLGALALNAAYVARVGGDIFHHARFLAHFVPVILVLGIVAVLELRRTEAGSAGDRSSTDRIAAGRGRPARLLLLGVLSVSVLLQAGVYPLEVLPPVNGDPRSGAIVGLTIREHTEPDATVAVVAAGNVPYFSRRRAVDLLGKNDPRVARQPPRCCPEAVGHNKFDPDYSFGLEPDLVVLLWPHSLVADYVEGLEEGEASGADGDGVDGSGGGGSDLSHIRKFWRGPAFARSRAFREHYFPNPVPAPSLLQLDGIYVRDTSPEIQRLDRWEAPTVRR